MPNDTKLPLDNVRAEILLRYLEDTNRDIRWWRERNWTAFRDAMVSYGAVGGFSAFKPSAFWVLIALILAVALSLHIYLGKNRTRYNENLSARRQVERALRLHDNDAYLDREILVPLPFVDERDADWRGTDVFRSMSWITAALVSAGLILTRLNA